MIEDGGESQEKIEKSGKPWKRYKGFSGAALLSKNIESVLLHTLSLREISDLLRPARI